MPTLHDIANVLRQHQGRYEHLDAFADDIDEVCDGTIRSIATILPNQPDTFLIDDPDGPFHLRFFADRGIVRASLGPAAQNAGRDRVAAGAALGGLLGTAIGSASRSKEGLLGNLILGILVGAVIGAAAGPLERVVAMQFDPASGNWRLYDGPLRRWAKRTLRPAA